MRFFILLFSFCLAVQFSFAQIPAGYYDSATGTGDVLRANLRDIITSGHVKLPYTSTSFDVWDAYAVTDVRPVPDNTVIWDMYSDIPSGSPVYTFTIFTDQCGTASAEGDCYSREHQMPNSWWGGLDNASNPQYTDLHHVAPSDQYVNNRKSNYIVAETTAPTWTSTNGSRIGPCSLTGFTGTAFEPINEYKGDFARAYLYLATRYMDYLSVWRNTYTSYDSKYIIATTGGNYLQWYIDMLVRWHNQDPVSQKEIDRNNAIYYNTPQHNRNPYIDHPEYVCLVWTSSYCASIPVITNIVQTPTYPAPANTVSVTADVTDDGSITSVVLQWCTDGVSFGNSIAMTLNGAPNYITSASIPAQTAGTTVTYRILATDDSGNTTTSATESYTVLKSEPSNHPTGFSCGTSTSTSVTLPWTDATGAVVPDGYLIKSSSVSMAAIADPVDGTPESNSTYVKNVSAGVQSVSFSGLPSSTTLYFKIYPYTNSSVNIDYKTSPAATTATCSTTTAGAGGACATDLIISEYVEGSGNTKYIEVYNGTGTAIDLSDYKLLLYANGATTPNTDYTMSGILADNSVVVYSNSAATAYTTDTIITTATFFNGNDALGLYKISTASYIDIFGRIGENPGTAWTSGSISTINMTLVRNSDVYNGVSSNPASGFPTLGTEWTAYASDDVNHLGSHTMTCAAPASTTAMATAGCSTGSVTISSSVLANQTFYLLSGAGAPIADWTGNTDVHVFTGLPSGNYKGYTVNAGVYSDTSAVVVLINDPASDGGSLNESNTEICLGNSTGLIILSGYTGTITIWETSNDGGATWTDIGFYDEQYFETPATAGIWLYRVGVVSGSCSVAYSNIASITVDPVSVGGTVNGATEICLGSSTGTLTLTGYVGTISKWQKSNDGGSTWTDIANTASTYSETPLTAGTWLYRSVVQSGVCSTVNSASLSITVYPTSVAGTVTGVNSDICLGDNTGAMTLAGNTGAIVKWQKSLNAGAWVDITNTAASYSETPASAGTWQYRAVIQSGVCSTVNSVAHTIVVNPLTVAGSVSGTNTEICLGNNTGTLTQSGYTGSITKWQKSNDGGSTWTDIANTAATYNETPLTAGTWLYRAVVQSGSCTSSNSASFSVTVNPVSVGGTVTAGVTQIYLGDNTGSITLASNIGAIVRWEKRLDGGAWTPIASTSNPYSEIPASVGFWDYRAVVQTGTSCTEAYSNFVQIEVLNSSAGAVSGGNSPICLGSSTGTMTLSGYTGTIIQWQKSNDGGSTWTNISNTGTTYSETPVIAGTWLYRAEIFTTVTIYSAPQSIVVNPATVGGSVTGGASVCLGSSTGILTLSGNTGSVIKWQVSTDGGSTWSDIANTATTYSTTPGAIGTYQYRAVVQSGVCTIENSTSTTVVVDPVTVAGSVTGGSTICAGSSTGTLTLGGHTGSIVKWQRQFNSGGWTDIANTTTTYSEVLAIAGVYEYRAVVQSGACSPLNSAITTVTVEATSVGGTVNGPNSNICLGDATGTLTLSGYTGTITKWQKSNDGGSTWIDIVNTTATYSEIPVVAGVWEYRAKVMSGSCSSAFSTAFSVTVGSVSVGGTLSGTATICAGSSTGTMTLTGNAGSIIKWQRSDDGGSTWSDIANTNATYSEVLASAGSYIYQVVVQNGSCGSATSSTFTVTVDPTTVPGTLAAGNATICEGSSTGIMTLSGYTGLVIKWQKRLDGGSWQDIVNTTNTYSETPASVGLWEYQAVVQSGSCIIANSNIVATTVTSGTVAGTLSGGNDICESGSTGTITLTGYTGTINKWQYRIDGGAWIDIANTVDTWTEILSTAGTYEYRSEVQSGACVADWSNVVSLNVFEQTQPGTLVVSPDTICEGTQAGPVVLSGYTGNINKWQHRVDGGSWSDIVFTGDSYSETPVSSGWWEYRPEVQNGICAAMYPVEIGVDVLPQPVASFYWNQNGSIITFTNTSLYANSYLWDFGDGNNSIDTDPVYDYGTTGEFYVTLTAGNGYCTSTYNDTIALITSLGAGNGPASVQVYPNPSDGQMYVVLQNISGSSVQVSVSDINGTILREEEFDSGNGKTDHLLSLDDLVPAVYFIQITSGGRVFHRKIVIE